MQIMIYIYIYNLCDENNLVDSCVLSSHYNFKRESSSPNYMTLNFKGGVGKFEKPARDTLFVIFHGMLLTSR